MFQFDQAAMFRLQRAPLHKRLAVFLLLILAACILIPLGLAVILVLIVLYIILSIVSMGLQVWRSVTGSLAGPDREGRRNVRVIVPERTAERPDAPPSAPGPAA